MEARLCRRAGRPITPWLLAAAALLAPAAALADGTSWRMGGHDRLNTRHQADERRISPANVARLAPRWVLATDGDISATPAVADGVLYVPDFAGYLYKIDARSGAVIWKVRLPAVSRGTPAVVGSRLIVPLLGMPVGGTCAGRSPAGACVLAVDARNGSILWQSQVDEHPLSYVTQSPVVEGKRVYVGTTSAEESLSAFLPPGSCCSFRGAVIALDLETGARLWKHYTVPDRSTLPLADRYSGAAVWGSTAVVDRKRNRLYVTTGNNYDAPAAVKNCYAATGSPSCDPAADNQADSVVALDLTTGALAWAQSFRGARGLAWDASLLGYDAWNLSCVGYLFGGTTANCPTPAGPDYDFAQGPMLLTTEVNGLNGRPRELLVAGQKSGVFWALDPDDGAVVWATVTGPGGIAGGLQWGSATDGRRIYFANVNSGLVPVTIDGVTSSSGFWGALDAATGQILWRTADPNFLSGAFGPVTVANGVVYAGSLGGPSPYIGIPGNHRTAPTMFALDAATGAVKWTHVAGGSVGGGAAVVDGSVYWGSGYANFGVGVDNKRLFAFELK